jgi:hypothetical protein
VPRFYFDLELNDGSVERDSVGLALPDAATALHECIDAIIDLPNPGVSRVMVRDQQNAVVMTINVDALGATVPRRIADNNSHQT